MDAASMALDPETYKFILELCPLIGKDELEEMIRSAAAESATPRAFAELVQNMAMSRQKERAEPADEAQEDGGESTAAGGSSSTALAAVFGTTDRVPPKDRFNGLTGAFIHISIKRGRKYPVWHAAKVISARPEASSGGEVFYTIQLADDDDVCSLPAWDVCDLPASAHVDEYDNRIITLDLADPGCCWRLQLVPGSTAPDYEPHFNNRPRRTRTRTHAGGNKHPAKLDATTVASTTDDSDAEEGRPLSTRCHKQRRTQGAEENAVLGSPSIQSAMCQINAVSKADGATTAKKLATLLGASPAQVTSVIKKGGQ
jgi:hypothetical protein